MRPIHALLAVAALAALLVAGLFLWTGSTKDPGAPGPSAPIASANPDSAAPAADLIEVPGAGSADRRIEPGAAETAITAALPVAAGASGTARRITGRVVDDGGRPVAGATVYAGAGGGFDELALDEIDPTEMFWMQRADAKTDAQGRFALEPKVETQVRLAVRAGGFAPLDTERAISATALDVGDLVVAPGVVLEGRVIDHVGRPVAGAELRRKRIGAGMFVMFAGRGGVPLGRTDDAGRFRLDQVAAGPWMLRITSDAHPDKEESGETTRPGEVVRGLSFQLEEGFEIAGRVTGAPPATLKDLRVQAGPGGAGGFGGEFAAFSGGVRSASVAADGSFVVGGCRKEARYRLTAREGRSAISFRSPTRSGSIDATAGDRGVEIPFRPETALVFQVVDAATGKPITEMDVSAGGRWAAPLTDEKNRPVRKFPDGRVRYGGLRRGPSETTAKLRVEAAGYAPYERADLALVDGTDNDLGVLRLERTAVVRVRVTRAADGQPIAGARVALEEVRDDPGMERFFAMSIGGGDDEEISFGPGAAQRGRTDAEGRVTLSSLPGSRGRLSVRHKEYAEWRSEPFDLPRGVDVERAASLSAGGTVLVTIVDPQGRPVSGQTVEHRPPGEGEAGPMVVGPGMGSPTSDADGRVTFAHLAPGAHGFRLEDGSSGLRTMGGGGFRMARSIRRSGGDFETGPEAPFVEASVVEGDTVEIRLVAPERARLVGRVREAGRPLAGATVRLREEGSDDLPFFGDGPKAVSDGSGEFALENVAIGSYSLVVSHAGRTMDHELEIEVRTGENRRNVDLPLSIVEGRVTGEDGKPLAGIRVRAERHEGREVERRFAFVVDGGDGPISFGGGPATPVTTDADGRYRLRGVQADVELEVTASGPGVQRGTSGPFQVAVDQTRSGVDIVLRPGVTLEVHCRRPDGSNATPCEVSAELQDEEGHDSKTEITNGEGRARLQGLKPGRWKVTARSLGAGQLEPGAAPAEQIVDLAVGPVKQITLEVR